MFRRFVRASVGATPTKMDSEELLDALNATLVHLGVRRAARLDSGTSSSLSARFVSSMKRNGGLRVVKWSDYEPIVIRENDAVAQSLCERLMRTEEDDEHHAIMGRLLGYGCPWVPSSVDQCWMFDFVVFFRRSNDNFKSRESGWLGGFKCGGALSQPRFLRLLTKYNRDFVAPANRFLAGASVRVRGIVYVVDHFEVTARPPSNSKSR